MTDYRILFIDDLGEIGDIDHTSHPQSAFKKLSVDYKVVVETMSGRTILSNVPEYPAEILPKLPVTHVPKPKSTETFSYNDGGRESAGYRGSAGDCTVRAIAIAVCIPYQDVYSDLFSENKIHNPRKASPRDGGTSMKTIHKYLKSLGWSWVPTMQIGSGCKVHLRKDELPGGNVIVRLSKHLCAVIDGVINDTYDPSRDGTRCVYGYWTKS